jgi:hypothetical protein
MIVSPPFLPAQTAAHDEDDDDARFVRSSMPGGDPDAGAYPVSFDMNWHGGSWRGVSPVYEAGAGVDALRIITGAVPLR